MNLDPRFASAVAGPRLLETSALPIRTSDKILRDTWVKCRTFLINTDGATDSRL